MIVTCSASEHTVISTFSKLASRDCRKFGTSSYTTFGYCVNGAAQLQRQQRQSNRYVCRADRARLWYRRYRPSVRPSVCPSVCYKPVPCEDKCL